jgi:hypothetical protein
MYLFILKGIVVAAEESSESSLQAGTDYDSVQHDPLGKFSVGDTYDATLFCRNTVEASFENGLYVKHVAYPEGGALGTSFSDPAYSAQYKTPSEHGFMYVQKSPTEVKYYHYGEGDMIYYAETFVDGIKTGREEYYSIADAASLEDFCAAKNIDNPYPLSLIPDMVAAPDWFRISSVKPEHIFGVSISSDGTVAGYARMTESELQEFLP